jgi:hypothetical protein
MKVTRGGSESGDDNDKSTKRRSPAMLCSKDASARLKLTGQASETTQYHA